MTRSRRWTAVFITSQLALAMVLLVVLAFGTRAQIADQRRDPPIDMSRVVTMSVALPARSYPTAAERLAFYERLSARVGAIGSIASVSIASALPFGGAAARQLVIEGRDPAGRLPAVWTVSVGSGYFAALGLPMTRGRALDERDGSTGYDNVVVNERFVDLYFPGENPLGRRIQLVTRQAGAGDPVWLTLVGVSPAVRQRPVREPDPVVYLPYRAEPPAVASIIMRGALAPEAIVPLVREQVRVLDPDLPLYRIMTLERAVQESQWQGRVSSLLLTLLACIAAGLAAVGLYGVTSYDVTQRAREIGIRMALGARPRQVWALVMQRSMRRLAVGVVVGIGSAVASRSIFGAEIGDPVNLASGAALLAIVGAAACLPPLRRATHLDPVVVLREE